MKTHTITLELLRQGPAYNQLLSKETPYLALCGNHDAETVRVGIEQAAANRRLRGMRYEDGMRVAAMARVEVAETVSALLGDIRSLLAELSAAIHRDQGLVHLRLVLSASELSMLPFELVTSPPGFPGQGQPLLLQTIAPVVLTREVRRTGATALSWPVRPRILIVVASPPQVSEVPMAAHVAAISEALLPWLVTRDRDGLAQYITVIPRATVAKVRAACAETAFTHVHILAHGYAATDLADRELFYGLAFHAEGNDAELDVVSGLRLASALRSHPAEGGEGLSCPAVVTVASCDSSNIGSVVTPGADVAHALHEAGIPLVLASQYPLSQRGSVVMTQAIYPRLLRGEDPRVVVHAMRQALQVDCPEGHDWASVTVYAALPDDVDGAVQRARFESVKRMVDAALARLDKTEEAIDARRAADQAAGAAAVELTDAERAQKADNQRALGAMIDELERVAPPDDGQAGQIRKAGVLGVAKKRYAHLFYRGPIYPVLGATRGPNGEAPSDGDIEAQRKARAELEEARDHYKAAFQINGSQAWTLVQHLALWSALDPPDAEGADPERAEDYLAYWTTAHTIAKDNLSSSDPQQVSWAHGALMELAVLGQLLPQGHPAQVSARAQAFSHMEGLLSTQQSRQEAYSMRRQLQRYADWWWSGRPEALRALPRDLSAKMLAYGVPKTLNAT
ncbi:MAG: CHAT domain-containing protein [Byssovorax sp.]